MKKKLLVLLLVVSLVVGTFAGLSIILNSAAESTYEATGDELLQNGAFANQYGANSNVSGQPKKYAQYNCGLTAANLVSQQADSTAPDGDSKIGIIPATSATGGDAWKNKTRWRILICNNSAYGLVANQKYILSAYFKAGDASQVGKKVIIGADNNSGNGSWITSTEITLTTSWQKASVVVSTDNTMSTYTLCVKTTEEFDLYIDVQARVCAQHRQ